MKLKEKIAGKLTGGLARQITTQSLKHAIAEQELLIKRLKSVRANIENNMVGQEDIDNIDFAITNIEEAKKQLEIMVTSKK